MSYLPYGKQNINRQDVRAVVEVLKSDWLTQGPKIAGFEAALAKYCGVKYAVAVSNGTAALHLAYLTAGLKKDDEVITTPNTFVATTNMILACGAKPVFCDIRVDTYNIDESKIERSITKKTKMIVPVHFAGQPAEMDTIIQIARKYKLVIIEDACHALGARYKNKKIGSLNSDLTVFSFHPVKPITTGEGGAIVTNSKKYYQKLMLLRSHGIRKDQYGSNVMRDLGYNYRLTDIQAALGISQLKRLDQFIKKRQQVVKWYKRELKDMADHLILPPKTNNCSSGWHLYVICVKQPRIRNKLMRHLQKNNIGVNFHYPAVYSHPYYQKIGYRNFKLPYEERYQKSCLTLPCHPQLSIEDISYISNAIKKFKSL